MNMNGIQNAGLVPTAQPTDDQITALFLGSFRDRSPYTLRNYKLGIERFRRFLAPKRLHDASWMDVEQFKASLLSGNEPAHGRLSPATATVQLVAVRSLYRWASDPNIGLLPHNPTTPVRMPKVHLNVQGRYLTKKELALFMNELREQGERNYLLGLMLVLTGLRVSELLGLRWGDFQEDVMGKNVWLTVRKGKGGKSRTVKIPPFLWKLLLRYRKQALADKRGAHTRVFELSVRQVDRIFEKTRNRCGMDKQATPHWFRHTNATLALLCGATLQQVQETLGHTAITTTQRYLHTVEQMKKAAPDYVMDGLKDLLPD